MNRNKLTIKDLVSIGVFAVIYFICMFAVGMMGVVPILYLVYPAAYALIGGPIVMLFMAKVNKPFGLLIFGMITPVSCSYSDIPLWCPSSPYFSASLQKASGGWETISPALPRC